MVISSLIDINVHQILNPDHLIVALHQAIRPPPVPDLSRLAVILPLAPLVFRLSCGPSRIADRGDAAVAGARGFNFFDGDAVSRRGIREPSSF